MLSYVLITMCFMLLWELVFAGIKKVKVHPVPGLRYIKITTFDRNKCTKLINIVHPVTRVIMDRRVEPLINCVTEEL